jgi:group I intron endonuclease
MESLYLYPELRAAFPELPATTVAALEQATQKKYRALRYDILWTGSAALPSCRYPQPFPVRADAWSVALDDDGRAIVSVRIGDREWRLRLKGGARYRRQLAGLRNMAQGGELALYKTAKGEILCKLVGWLRRPVTKEGTGTLYVRTCSDKLLVAEVLSGETGKIGIYKITGPAGRVYVGQSINIDNRWTEHKGAVLTSGSYYSERLKADVAEHGWGAFNFDVIEETLSLDERELHWIKQHSSHLDGYNNQSEMDRLTGKHPNDYRGNEEHREVWAENCDNIRRLCVQYAERCQRLSEDRKAEMGPNRSFQRSRKRFADKHHNRMSSAIQEIAAHLAKFAARRKFARVVYDDSVQWGEGLHFRYFELALRIKTKLDEAGIEFVKKSASGEVVEETPQPLAEELSYA